MAALDWCAIEAARVAREPFDHILIPQALAPDCAAALARDYPPIRSPGSFSLADVPPRAALAALIDDLQSARFRAEMQRIFGLDLTGKPSVATLRGRCAARDGRIHTDSRAKLISVLIYLNDGWESPDGRLRLLRSGGDIDDYAIEIPPTLGTLVALRRSARSWHGHTRFVGQRRLLQFNYLDSPRYSLVGDLRHRLSALAKHVSLDRAARGQARSPDKPSSSAATLGYEARPDGPPGDPQA